MPHRRRLIALLTPLVLSACSDNKAPPTAPPPSPEIVQGEKVVKGLCINCHGQGINNAPILGNKRMWEKRIAQGEAVLLQHALNGYNMMPARGGNPQLSDDDIHNAVQYMMSLVQ